MAYEIRKLQQYKIDAVNALKEQFEGRRIIYLPITAV